MISTKADETQKTFSPYASQERVEGVTEIVPFFSVDQIREEESPWKALLNIASVDRSVRRASPFKKRLQERKKVRMLYGNLPRRVYSRYYKEASRPEDLLLALESRLDIVLKRSALFSSVHSARKSILQGGISVNNTCICSPRYHCSAGDLIQVVQKRVPQTFSTAKSKYKITKKTKSGLICNTFRELFVFSELLQLFDRKAGRLHTSALSYLESINSTVLQCTQESKKALLTSALLSRTKNGFPQASRLTIYGDKNNLKKDTLQEGREQMASTAQLTTQEKSKPEQPSSRGVASRPLHLEVSYRDLCVVFLYPPQRICVDVSINLSLLC